MVDAIYYLIHNKIITKKSVFNITFIYICISLLSFITAIITLLPKSSFT